MTFCSACGWKLNDDDRFCPGCGKQIESSRSESQERQSVWEGTTHKCPECGAPIPSFAEKCPVCGHEFRDVEAVGSARELAERLDAIEATRPKGENKKRLNDGVNATDEQKISLIRSYPIPNAKEDLLEFLVLALSNCSVSFDWAGDDSSTASEKAIREAWKAKSEQALNKCLLLFGGTPEAERAKTLYEEKMSQIESETKSARWRMVRFFAGFILAMFIIMLFTIFSFSLIKMIQ